MVVPRAAELVLGGIPYRLATQQGVRQFSVQDEPGDQNDLVPFRLGLPFGYAGIGSSIEAVPNQIDYCVGIRSNGWGEIEAGPTITTGPNLNTVPAAAMAVAQGTTLTSLAAVAPASATAAGAGTVWNNPGNVLTSNNVYSTVVLGVGGTSNNLKPVGSAPAIPAGGVVRGITVSIESRSTAAARFNVQLLKAGTATGDIKTAVVPGAEAVVSLGSTTDLWSVTLTAADLLDANFGVQITATDTSGAGSTVDVDQVTIVATYATASGETYLYIGAGPNLYKFRQSDGTIVDTHTFAHATAPVITDVLVVKDGAASGTGFILVAFGNSAPIAEVDLIGAAADTYRTQAALGAYGGKLAVATSEKATDPYVWKSTGTSGQQGGAFARLQSLPVQEADQDFTAAATWDAVTPTPYKVGSYATDITDLVEWNRALLVGKPEGIYAFDANFNAVPVLSMKAWPSTLNCQNMLPWERSVMVPTSADLMEWPPPGADATVGPSTLLSMLEPSLQGNPVALGSRGPRLYMAANCRGAVLTIFEARRRGAENVPHELVWRPIYQSGAGLLSLNSTQMTVASFTSAGTTYTRLYWVEAPTGGGSPYVLKYLMLEPDTARTNQGGGVLRSRRFGEPDKRIVLHRIVVYGVGLVAGSYGWTPAVLWDEGGATAIGDGSNIDTNGRVVKSFTPAVNDSGRVGRIQLTAVTPGSSVTGGPKLRGTNYGRPGEPGIGLEGSMQADSVERVRFALVLGEGMELGTGGKSQYDGLDYVGQLRNFRSPILTTLSYDDYWGMGQTQSFELQTVNVTHWKKDGDRPAQWVAECVGRVIS